MKLILGLGNPGREYEQTRHNVGAEVAALAAGQAGVRLARRSLQSWWGQGRRGGEDVVFALPTTYMNLSGRAAAALLRHFTLTPESLLVVVDDFNLPLGQLRFRAQGSAGGHNGLESIIQELNSQSFHRLRVGIDRPPQTMDITDFVLGPFSDAEASVMQPAREQAATAVLRWIDHGITRAMTEFNAPVPEQDAP
ncbi:MAG: aminoacyl-tRNA hydrolase [candidate division FCPU426 bacterium]